MLNVNNLFTVKNKNILITGCSGFLGRNMAEFFGSQGANIFLQGKDKKKVNSLSNRLLKKKYNVVPLVFDLLDENQLKNVINKELKKLNIDVLINNAYKGVPGSVFNSESSDFRNSYEISVVAVNNLIKILYPNLLKSVKKNGDSSIINISSIYGFLSPDINIYDSFAKANPPFYGAAKAALIQYTKYTACEFAKDGIRVNCISPGSFPSLFFKKNNPNTIKKLIKKIPLNRFGNPDDLYGPLLYLSSSSSKYVTGTNLIVDGGFSSW